jgi:outer membrane receptor protein involved in Fe transport
MARNSLILSSALVGSLALLPQLAFAQSDQPNESVGLGEIVVTAQKREQNLNDIGISVAVLSGDQLEAQQISSSTDIVNLAANVENTGIFGPGTNTNFSIRGVTQNDYNDATEAPIATYLDDIYLVVTGAGSFPLYDMQRVEVLRGPQGTLFGRNSTGGVIHYITANPEFDVTTGQLSAEYGSRNLHVFEGFVNAGFSDKAALRVSGHYSNKDGFMKHITGNQPDGGEIETASIRGALSLRPTETVTNTLKLSYGHASGPSSGIFRDIIDQNPANGELFVVDDAVDTFGYGSVGRDGFKSDNGQFRALKGASSFFAANKLDWEASDNVTITSVTGYNKYKRDVVEDCDGSQARECATHYDNNSWQFSQELRAFIEAGKARITLGGFYLKQKVHVNQVAPLFQEAGNGGVILWAKADQDLEGYAAFANLEYEISPQLTVIVGGRVAHDKKHINEFYNVYLPPEGADLDNPFPTYTYETEEIEKGIAVAEDYFNDANAGGLNRISKSSWNAMIELDYKPVDGTLVYVKASRGTKAPGFNHGFISSGYALEEYPYKQETIYAYEGGVKTDFGSPYISVSLSGYYYDYKNYQTLNYVGVGSIIKNFDGKLYGAEAEFLAKPVDGLTLSMNAGYSHSTLKDVPNSGGFIKDRDFPIAPSWTLSGMIRYETPILAGDNLLGVWVSGRARDKFYNNPDNDPAATVPSFGKVDAGLDVSFGDGRYKLALVGKNIFDKRYETQIFPLLGVAKYRYGFYGEPRTISVKATVNF